MYYNYIIFYTRERTKDRQTEADRASERAILWSYLIQKSQIFLRFPSVSHLSGEHGVRTFASRVHM